MESQYPGTDWMEAKERYCNEDGYLDEVMVVKTWIMKDGKGKEGFPRPEDEIESEGDD